MAEITSPKCIPGLRALYVEQDGTLWTSRNYQVMASRDHGQSFHLVTGYQPTLMASLASSWRLSSRLFRCGFHALLPLPDGALVGVVRKHIVRFNPTEKRFRSVFRIQRGSRPLNLCQGLDGRIYWGEYFNNPMREPVHIYASKDHGLNWEKVYTFPGNTIRHIHKIIYDPYRKGYWVLTGDMDAECKILFSNDEFQNLETVIAGNQHCRAVSIIPLPDGLIVPTDTPMEQNYIQYLDVDLRKLEILCPISGSAFDTAIAGNIYLISTAVEPSNVNKSNYATLLYSKDGYNWKEFYKQKKDKWHMRYFQYGLFNLPAGPNPGPMVYAESQALKYDDGKLLSWDIQNY